MIYKQGEFISYSSRDWNIHDKVPEDMVSWEDSLSASQFLYADGRDG